MQQRTVYDSDTSTGSNALVTTEFRYDASGNYASISIDDGSGPIRDRTVTFVTGADGLILQRDETDTLSTGDPRELHYYFAGQRIGDTGNDGTSDVDYVQSIAEHTVPNGTGPFRNGWDWYATTPRADFDQSPARCTTCFPRIVPRALFEAGLRPIGLDPLTMAAAAKPGKRTASYLAWSRTNCRGRAWRSQAVRR